MYSCRGHTLSKLQSLVLLESLSMAECPCITDSSLASLSNVTSLRVLNMNHCDKITDNGVVPHIRPLHCHRPYCQCLSIRASTATEL